MSEYSAEATPLSLLAEFDDINRCNSVLNDGAVEEYFVRFLDICENWHKQYSIAECEVARLQKELQDALKAISAWEAKFTHARKLLDAEKKHRLKAEHERELLEKQITLARDLLFSDNREKLNNETLEKLAFLNNTTAKYNSHLEQGLHRLNTINERLSMDSTGNLLSDQSFSRSEDDLDESVANGRKSWRRHRPSGVAPQQPEEHPPVKKRKSVGSDKKVNECHKNNNHIGNTNGVTSSTATSGNGGRVVATTTVTVDRCNANCSGNGRITASSVIEGIPSNGTSENEVINTKSEPAMTPKPINAEYNIKIESKNDGFYNTNIKNFAPTAPLKQDVEAHWGSTPITGTNVCSPRGTARLRQHTFVNKTVIRPEPCTTCNNRIRFAKAVVKCSDCRAVCHIECKDRLPLPCVPSHFTPNSNSNHIGTIADFTPTVSPMIPALIIHCVNEVESRGLTEVGLYRVPGSEKEVKALKEKFMRGKGTPPLTNVDINVVCGCVKDFLRSLKEPLVTYSLWSDFVSATELEDKNDRQAALFQAISELPQPNRDTLAFMMLHLQRVAECVECKMPAENLAKVFGPTIVGYSDGDPEPNYMYIQTLQQFKVMESLLDISSDYWARFTGVTCSDGSGVAATPPPPTVLRTPSLRPRLPTVAATTTTPRSTFARQTPRSESVKSSTTSQSSKRGFFYTPISDGSSVPRKNRKFYEPHRLQVKYDQNQAL